VQIAAEFSRIIPYTDLEVTMAVSVYFSNENIVVISGKAAGSEIKVSSMACAPLPAGTLINGMVINDELVQSRLLDLRSKGVLPKSGIRLVIDRSSVLVKFMTVPRMNSKSLMELLKSTFSGAAETRNELVYDYSVIDQDEGSRGNMQILGCAIEKALVEDYVNLFKSAGIGLGSIDIALNAVLKFKNFCSEYKDTTFILSFIDAENVFSLLFVDGRFSFSNRFRLTARRGTMESASEFNNMLSSIIQFNKTQKNNREIELALLCGLRDDEEWLQDQLKSTLNLKVERFLRCPAIKLSGRLMAREPDVMKNLIAVANLIR